MSITLAAAALVITIWFNGAPVSCHVDTGSPVTILSQTTANRVPALGPPVGKIGLVGVGGEHTLGNTYHVANAGNALFGWNDGRILVFPDEKVGVDCLLGRDYLGRQPIGITWSPGAVFPL